MKASNHVNKMNRDRCGERGIDLLCPFNLEAQLIILLRWCCFVLPLFTFLFMVLGIEHRPLPMQARAETGLYLQHCFSPQRWRLYFIGISD